MIANLKKLTFKSTAVAIALFTLIGTAGLTTARQAVANSINSSPKTLSTESALPTQDKYGAATLWAEALSQRQGSLRYAILTDELKAVEYENYKDMNWVIGGSSPWVVSYTVKEKNKIDNDTYAYEINYTLTDSTRGKYASHETITVKKFGRNWFVAKHDNYDNVPDITKSNAAAFAKVQPHKDNALITKAKEGTVNLWAEALKQRHGTFRYAILTNELKAVEYENYKNVNWAIGGSSPWVVSYTVKEKNKIDNDTYAYEINYTLTDSTRGKYASHETITVKKLGRNWFVTNHDNYDSIPDITKSNAADNK